MKKCSSCIHNKPTGRTFEQSEWAKNNFLLSKPNVVRKYDQCQKEHPMPLPVSDAAKCKDYKWVGDGKDYVVNVKAKGGCVAYQETRKRGN